MTMRNDLKLCLNGSDSPLLEEEKKQKGKQK